MAVLSEFRKQEIDSELLEKSMNALEKEVKLLCWQLRKINLVIVFGIIRSL